MSNYKALQKTPQRPKYGFDLNDPLKVAQYKGLDKLRPENEVCFCHSNVIPIVIGEGILKRSSKILQNSSVCQTNHVDFDLNDEKENIESSQIKVTTSRVFANSTPSSSRSKTSANSTPKKTAITAGEAKPTSTLLWKTFGDTKIRKQFTYIQLAQMVNGVDGTYDSKSGKGRFLKGPLIFLEQAVINLALQVLAAKNFVAMYIPKSDFMNLNQENKKPVLRTFNSLISENSMEENILNNFEPLNTQLQTLDMDELPEKIAAISTNFLLPQRNAFGTSNQRGSETGIRLQQTQKVEQLLICRPSDTQTGLYFREMLESVEELYQKLKLPYRFIVTDSAETEILENSNKKLIAEIWFSGVGIFQPLIYSNSVDCSAKRVKIERTGYSDTLHMLNVTVCRTHLIIQAILENCQAERGILVPEVLRKWMPNNYEKLIPFTKSLD